MGDYLDEAQGSAGATGWDVMAEMCLGDGRGGGERAMEKREDFG